jgi:hypothetical protein
MKNILPALIISLSACADDPHIFPPPVVENDPEAPGIISDFAGHDTGVVLHSQEQWHWCWAAQSQSLLSWYGVERSQCEIVSIAFNRDCCSKPDTCNNDFYITQYGEVNLRQYSVALPSSADDFRAYLDDDKSIVLRYVYEVGGSHFISVTGYGSAVGCADDEFLEQDSGRDAANVKRCKTFERLQDNPQGTFTRHISHIWFFK